MSETNENAFDRLERAAQAQSRAAGELRDAAAAVAADVEMRAPVGVRLPRDYEVVRVRSNVGDALFLVKRDADDDHDAWIDGHGGYLHGDFHAEIPEASHDDLLAFAADVKDGWLDELAAWLDDRAAASGHAAAALRASLRRDEA